VSEVRSQRPARPGEYPKDPTRPDLADHATLSFRYRKRFVPRICPFF